MSEAARRNETIRAHLPAAFAAMSDLGRRMYFPQGVPSQARDARNCAINATIGQITDGHGHAVPLPSLASHATGLPGEKVFLYAAQGGVPELRQAWRARMVARAPTRAGLPIVTAGITHGLSIVADLFVDADTTVLLPTPCWDNYQLIFDVRREGRIVPYNAVNEQGFDIDALRAALAACTGKTLLLLNVPSNPHGYTPTLAEADAILNAINTCKHPIVVVCDDAYHGMVWEDGLLPHSLFHRLSFCDPNRVLAVKLDGATKELFFFGGRVGFVTVGAEGPGAEALEDKLLGLARSTVSAAATASQHLVLSALLDENTVRQQETILADMKRRYRHLKEGLIANGVPFMPFNSAFFALIRVKEDPHAIRHRLLQEGVGVVASPDAGAVRVSYASVSDDQIPALVAALVRHAH